MGERETVGHISDPGKTARAEAGLPVVPSFDGFRAFAILGVVALHLVQVTGFVYTHHQRTAMVLWSMLGKAVEVLFIVSGFVVFLPAAARGGRPGPFIPYAIRRGARLLPAYWLVILVSLLLLALFPLSDATRTGQALGFPGSGEILLNLSLTAGPASLFDSIPAGFGIDPPLWTLAPEVAFYLVLPLCAYAFFRRPVIGLVIAAAITFVWMLAFANLNEVAANLGFHPGFNTREQLTSAAERQLPYWTFSFGLGMAGAVTWIRLKRSRIPKNLIDRRTRNMLAPVVVVALVSFWFVSRMTPTDLEAILWSMLCSASIATLMITITFLPDRWQRPFANHPVRKLGDISYGVYLSHFVFMTLAVSAISFSPSGSFSDLLLMTLLVIPPTLLYGYLSARFLEQPIRRWARKYGRQGPPGTPVRKSSALAVPADSAGDGVRGQTGT